MGSAADGCHLKANGRWNLKLILETIREKYQGGTLDYSKESLELTLQQPEKLVHFCCVCCLMSRRRRAAKDLLTVCDERLSSSANEQTSSQI